MQTVTLSLPLFAILGIASGLTFVASGVALIIYSIAHASKLKYYLSFSVLTLFSLFQVIFSAFIVQKMDFKYSKFNFVQSLYFFIEYSALVYFFWNIIKNKNNKILVKFWGSLIIPIAYFIIYKNPDFIPNNFAISTGIYSISMLTLPIMTFWELIQSDKLINLKKNPEFIVATATFFLFSFALPIALLELILPSATISKALNTLTNSVNLLTYALFFNLLLYALKCKIKSLTS